MKHHAWERKEAVTEFVTSRHLNPASQLTPFLTARGAGHRYQWPFSQSSWSLSKDLLIPAIPVTQWAHLWSVTLMSPLQPYPLPGKWPFLPWTLHLFLKRVTSNIGPALWQAPRFLEKNLRKSTGPNKYDKELWRNLRSSASSSSWRTQTFAVNCREALLRSLAGDCSFHFWSCLIYAHGVMILSSGPVGFENSVHSEGWGWVTSKKKNQRRGRWDVYLQ